MRSHLSMEHNPFCSCFLRSCQRCRSVSGWELQRPRLLTLFSRIVEISFPLTENFISLQFPFSNDKLRHFEGFILIAAHLKNSWRQVTSCSMCDLDSAIRVTSSIKAFVEKRKISYFGLARNLIRHSISPNQDDLSYSARTFISG